MLLVKMDLLRREAPMEVLHHERRYYMYMYRYDVPKARKARRLVALVLARSAAAYLLLYYM